MRILKDKNWTDFVDLEPNTELLYNEMLKNAGIDELSILAFESLVLQRGIEY